MSAAALVVLLDCVHSCSTHVDSNSTVGSSSSGKAVEQVGEELIGEGESCCAVPYVIRLATRARNCCCLVRQAACKSCFVRQLIA
jgi:hypothetical protein